MIITRSRIIAAVTGALIVGLLAPAALATDISQQEFRSSGACAEWTNTIDDHTQEFWEVCASMDYQYRLFGAIEKMTAQVDAHYLICQAAPFGSLCGGDEFYGYVAPADVSLDANNNVTGVHTTVQGCDIALAIAGTGANARYADDYRKLADSDVVTVDRYHDTYAQEGAVGTGTACGWTVVASHPSDFGGRGQSDHTGLAVHVHDGQ